MDLVKNSLMIPPNLKQYIVSVGPVFGNGGQIEMHFPNGYGASIISSKYSYGGDEGKFEIAVLKRDAGRWDICYDTPITDDVVGYLDVTEAKEVLIQIMELSEVS
jgi:hypothetical protein